MGTLVQQRDRVALVLTQVAQGVQDKNLVHHTVLDTGTVALVLKAAGQEITVSAHAIRFRFKDQLA